MTFTAFSPIGVAAFGDSTLFAYWGFRLVNDIVAAVTGSATTLHVASLPELREGFAARAGKSVVVTSDFAEPELAAFVAASGLPLILFVDETDVLLNWIVTSRSLDLETAARLSSRIYAAIAPVAAAPRTLVISRADNQTPREIAAAIVACLWPARGEALAEAGFGQLIEVGNAADEPPEFGEGEEALALGVTPERLAAAKACLDSYAASLAGRASAEILWPLSLFTRLDGRLWGEPIELTGPARALFYGPYMHLPVGEWNARVEFEIDGAVSGVEATTDVLINEIATEKTFAIPAKGIFAYALTFRVKDPHHPVEIRLFKKKSAIEGVFLPRSVSVRRAGPA